MPYINWFRINRYIVGCKFRKRTNTIYHHRGINRYIVGCKSSYFTHYSCFMFELIDTQWDVNYNKTKKIKQEKERINRYIVGCKY